MRPHQGSVEGEENLPRPAGHTPPNASQDAIGLLGSRGTLLAHGQPVTHQHSQVPLSTELLSSRSAPSLYWCMGLFLPRCRTLPLPWLNLIRFLSAQLSSLSRSVWMAAQPAGVSTTPPSFVSSANLLRVHSNSSSKSFHLHIFIHVYSLTVTYTSDFSNVFVLYPLWKINIKTSCLERWLLQGFRTAGAQLFGLPVSGLDGNPCTVTSENSFQQVVYDAEKVVLE